MTKWEKKALIRLLNYNQSNYESHVLKQQGHLDEVTYSERKRTQVIVEGLSKEIEDDKDNKKTIS